MRSGAARHADAPRKPGDAPESSVDERGIVSRVVVGVCIAAIVLWALFLARRALLLIYVSAVLAIGFSPLVRFIEQQRLRPIGARIPRWAAILSIYASILGVVMGTGFVTLPILIAQARELVNQLPSMLVRAQRALLEQGLVPPEATVATILQQAPGTTDVIGTVLFSMFDLLGGMFGLVAILGLTFYLLVESEAIFSTWLRLFPPAVRPNLWSAATEITARVSSWLAMQAMLGVLIGTTTLIGLGLLGVPYVYVLALVAAIGEVIPIIGPILAAIPGIIVAASVSWPLALAAAAFYLLQQQVENHIIVPTLLGDRVGLSAAVVIIALLLGGSLLGVLGVILAIPTAAILQVILQHAVADR
jgi:predicted PurR-regulated permease PerM